MFRIMTQSTNLDIVADMATRACGNFEKYAT